MLLLVVVVVVVVVPPVDRWEDEDGAANAAVPGDADKSITLVVMPVDARGTCVRFMVRAWCGGDVSSASRRQSRRATIRRPRLGIRKS